jgi:deoxyribonucleoside regulator
VHAARRRGAGDTRLMVRIAQMYYRMHLSQEQIGERLGLSRFRVGRLLDRALREEIVRIEVVHPDAHAVDLEERLVQRFGLVAAIVADVPAAVGAGQDADDLARDAVAEAAVEFLAIRRPTGAIAVSWGRTMLALARRLPDGWTQATEIVQINGATSRSGQPTRANEILERFASTSGATFRGLAAPAIVGSAELRDALMQDPAIRETVDAARSAPAAVFGLGIPAPDSPHLASGFVDENEQARLRAKGAVGDVIGRFLDADGEVAWPKLNRRTVGLPLDQLASKPFRMGVAAGAGRGPIALAAIRGGYVNVLATDDATAAWVLAHG